MATSNRAVSPESATGDPGATPKNSTFSMRLKPSEFEILNSLAKLHKKSIAELAREFIREGIRNALDPQEIDRRFEEEKKRLMAASVAMRDAAASAAPDDVPVQHETDDSHKV